MAEPKKNTAFTFAIGLVATAARPAFKANPTIAAGDFKVSTDGAAFANLATLPSVAPALGTRVQIDLSAAEMNGDNIYVQCIDAAGAEWDDVLITIDTSVRNADDLAFPATSGRSITVSASGVVDSNLAQILGTALTETAGQIAAAFKKFFNIATPAATMDHLILVDTVTTATTATNLTNLPAAAALEATLTAMKGATFAEATDSLEALRNRGDAAWITATGFATPTNITAATGIVLSGVTHTGAVIPTVTTVGTLTTYTGNTPQTGDSFARIGAPAGASIAADVAAVKADTAATLTDTNELQTDWANGGRLDLILDARSSQTSVDDLPTNAELATALATADDAVLAQVALVKAQTDSLTFTSAGKVDANMLAIGGDTTALTAFKRAVLANVIGTVGAASSPTSIVTSSLTPAAAVTDQFKGRILIFDKDTTTANLRGQGSDITASTAAGVLTVTSLTDAPVSGDTFTIT